MAYCFALSLALKQRLDVPRNGLALKQRLDVPRNGLALKQRLDVPRNEQLTALVVFLQVK